uniref:SCP domain-containing protein n=1 Tax=Glossina brevipalpis TaxID=37001 RepID=A0A1A9W0G3_9MUSC
MHKSSPVTCNVVKKYDRKLFRVTVTMTILSLKLTEEAMKLLIGIVGILAVTLAENDYCQYCRNHVTCLEPPLFKDSCPLDATLSNLDSVRESIINFHNEKRNFIAGGGDKNHKFACRMATMSWNEELAEIAKYNVRKCALRYDSCFNTSSFKYPGQNLGTYRTTLGIPIDERIKWILLNWYKQVANSRDEFVESYPYSYYQTNFSHFAIMMSDRNIVVGCAASSYSEYAKKLGITLNTTLLACNYATTNMVGFPIYDTNCSKAALNCASGFNEKYLNLCSLKERYNIRDNCKTITK